MLNLVGEILEGADGDRLLRRVAGRPVAFCQVGHDDLDVSFRSKSSAFKQRLFVVHTTLVDVESSLNVVESVADARKFLPEVVVKELLRIGSNTSLVRNDFHVGVHPLNGRSCGNRLGLLDVRVPEQKLPRKVRLLDEVHVRQKHLTFLPTSQSHRGPRLEHLAPDRSGTDQEVTQIQNLLVHRPPKHRNLMIVHRIRRLALLLRRQHLRQHLHAIKAKKLHGRHELPRHALDRLLRHNPAQHRRHRREPPRGRPRERLDHPRGVRPGRALGLGDVHELGERPGVLGGARLGHSGGLAEGEEALADDVGALHLAVVQRSVLRVLLRLLQRLEVDEGRKHHVRGVPAARVRRQLLRIHALELERIRARHLNLHRIHLVQLHHPLHLPKLDEIPGLEPVPMILQTRHRRRPLGRNRNRRDQHAPRRLPRGILHHEPWPEVHEHVSKHPRGEARH
mmetsp:Transcript_5693/g.13777  ORF Transcript_5693/g.13777 Transcript_5693/m.13777 type:complete len:452 (-) Transcript_5693:242-1597(-)